MNIDSRIQWTLNYTMRPMTDGPVQVKNGDCNNAGSFSSDYVGGNYRWPDGTYEPGSFSRTASAAARVADSPARTVRVAGARSSRIMSAISRDSCTSWPTTLGFRKHCETG